MANKINQNYLYYGALAIAALGVILYVFLPKGTSLDTALKPAEVQQTVQTEFYSDTGDQAEVVPGDSVPQTKSLQKSAPPESSGAPAPAADLESFALGLEKVFDVIYAFVQDMFLLIVSGGGAIAAIYLKVKYPTAASATPTARPASKRTSKLKG